MGGRCPARGRAGRGFAPAELDALKPVLVNSAHVAERDEGRSARGCSRPRSRRSSIRSGRTTCSPSIVGTVEAEAVEGIQGSDGTIEIAGDRAMGRRPVVPGEGRVAADGEGRCCRPGATAADGLRGVYAQVTGVRVWGVMRTCDERGQMTVELAAAFPVLIIVAVIAVNAPRSSHECAAFDNVFRDAVRVHARAAAGQVSSRAAPWCRRRCPAAFDAGERDGARVGGGVSGAIRASRAPWSTCPRCSAWGCGRRCSGSPCRR